MPLSPKYAFSFAASVRSNGFVQLETLVPAIEGLSPAPPLNPYPHTFALLLWQAAAHELIIPLPFVAYCKAIAGGITSNIKAARETGQLPDAAGPATRALESCSPRHREAVRAGRAVGARRASGRAVTARPPTPVDMQGGLDTLLVLFASACARSRRLDAPCGGCVLGRVSSRLRRAAARALAMTEAASAAPNAAAKACADPEHIAAGA